MSSATPPQMNPVVSVATTSGMREKATTRPFSNPWRGAGDQHDDGEGQGLAKVGVLHEARGEDVRHRDHRADREVDAAADDDDRLRGGGKRERQGAERQGLNLERTEIGVEQRRSQPATLRAEAACREIGRPGLACARRRRCFEPPHRSCERRCGLCAGQPVRGPQEARFVGFRRRHFAGDAAAEQDDRPIAGEANLRQFGGEQENGQRPDRRSRA